MARFEVESVEQMRSVDGIDWEVKWILMGVGLITGSVRVSGQEEYINTHAK